jgi:DNA repair protein RecO (recombination protein O)
MASYKSTIFETKAIVIRHMPIGEADRLVTFYSEKFGKVRAIARGVRRYKSKMSGHLDILNLVSISVGKGKGIDIITEVDSLNGFFTLKKDLKNISLALYLAELVESVSMEESPNEELFDLFVSSLNRLINVNEQYNLLRYFEIKLLGYCGFGPELNNCLECFKILPPADHYFSSYIGGVICFACGQSVEGAKIPIKKNTIKLFRYYQKYSNHDLPTVIIPKNNANELKLILNHYIKSVIGKEMKSTKFLDLITKQT